jgi:Uma2 family endonuclease
VGSNIQHFWVELLTTVEFLIVEVLSDSTEAYDRSEKFYRYRRNPILQEYVLVSAKSISIDLFRKNDNGEWVFPQYRAGDTVELRSIDLSFPNRASLSWYYL